MKIIFSAVNKSKKKSRLYNGSSGFTQISTRNWVQTVARLL